MLKQTEIQWLQGGKKRKKLVKEKETQGLNELKVDLENWKSYVAALGAKKQESEGGWPWWKFFPTNQAANQAELVPRHQGYVSKTSI